MGTMPQGCGEYEQRSIGDRSPRTEWFGRKVQARHDRLLRVALCVGDRYDTDSGGRRRTSDRRPCGVSRFCRDWRGCDCRRSGGNWAGGVGERVPPGVADLGGAPSVGFDHAAVPQVAVGGSRVALCRVAGGAAVADVHRRFLGHGTAAGDPAQSDPRPANRDLWYCGVIEPNAWGAAEIRHAWWHSLADTTSPVPT